MFILNLVNFAVFIVITKSFFPVSKLTNTTTGRLIDFSNILLI